MKAHIVESELKPTELEFNKKVYEVDVSLSVMKKIENLDEDDVESVAYVSKMIAWLVNDAIERENILSGTHEKTIPLEVFEHLIGASNLDYYKGIINKLMGIYGDEEIPELDDDGNETVVTDEMIEEYGEPVKNAKTE
nr:MAG TPA: hypothetical protein [Caudoviricetes sp.]